MYSLATSQNMILSLVCHNLTMQCLSPNSPPTSIAIHLNIAGGNAPSRFSNIISSAVAEIIGVPSIALSYKWRDDGSPMNEVIIEMFLDKYFDRMCRLAQDTSTFVNVNFPIPLGCEFPPIKTTFVSKGMTYEDKIVSFDAPNKKRYLWIDNPQDTAIMYASLEHGSDAYELLVQHNITISLVEVYPKGKEFTL